MAKQYYAVNKIKHGRGKGQEPLIFERGQQVSGLPKEEMILLWNAGVLTEVDPDDRPQDDRDEKIAALQAEIERLKAQPEVEQPIVEPPVPTTLPAEEVTDPTTEGSSETPVA